MIGKSINIQQLNEEEKPFNPTFDIEMRSKDIKDSEYYILDINKENSYFFENINNLKELVKIAQMYKYSLNLPIPNTLLQILDKLKNVGAQGLLVGGAVRDAILGKPSKDIDIEVYNLLLDDLLSLLNTFGNAHIEGKSFGVIKLKDEEGFDYDFSLPRRDSKMEEGRSEERGRGVSVELDSSMTPEEASKRRDFTINSMYYDPVNQELYDYHNGLYDLHNAILRATDIETFTDDPLRVLRGMQFVARFGLDVDPQTAQLCKSLKNKNLQQARVREEWMKFFTKCTQPSKGLEFLIETEWIDNYPELKGIVGVPQEPAHHPEGNVEKHTAYTMDAASRIADEKGLIGDDKAILVASALCHDLGKATTTDTSGEKITSYGHHKESAKLTQSFLESIGMKKDISEVIVPLVEEHMAHIFFDPNSKKSTVLHLAEKLNKATIKQLEMVIRSDMAGRPPLEGGLPDKAEYMIELAKEKGVYSGKAQDLISGAELLSLSPTIYQSKELGNVLRDIKEKQLRGDINTKDEAFAYAREILPNYFALINGNDVVEALGGQSGSIVGEILHDAWEAQMSGEFVDRENALEWLNNYINTTVETNYNLAQAKTIDELLKIATPRRNIDYIKMINWCRRKNIYFQEAEYDGAPAIAIYCGGDEVVAYYYADGTFAGLNGFPKVTTHEKAVRTIRRL